MEPLISIIVPAYNIESYLERCLDSIVGQTYQNIEIIVVDDGSVDDTGKIADKYVNQYPECVKCIHKSNGGVTSARLTGIKAAKGDWIGFVDGDDIIEPDMYEKLLYNAIKYNAKISHCGYQMVFDDGRINYFYNTGRVVLQDNLTGIKDLLEGTFVEPGLCNKLFHKSLLQSLLHDDLMDKSIKINEDLLMNYYLFLESDLSIYEDFCPYHYVVRYTSASRAKLNEHKIFDPIRVKKVIYKNAPVEIKDVAKKVYISTCINTYNALSQDKKYKREKSEVYLLIQKEKKNFYLLNKKLKLLGSMICNIPFLYPIIYGIYSRYFQKKRYE